jgi:hypothetical protein
VRNKYIKSGDIIEIYEYERNIKVQGNKSGRGGREEAVTDKEKNRADSLARAKKTLRRLINANVGEWGKMAKFVTLTFRENMTDIKKANYEFKKFIKRLNYEFNEKFKYSAVIEFQKRGAIHYHVIFYDLIYIPVKALERIWGNGFVKINKIDQVDNVGAYVTKYMSKDNGDPRLAGEKSYFNSRGLHKPLEIDIEKKEKESLKETLKDYEAYKADFENDYAGNIVYTQYNLKRPNK